MVQRSSATERRSATLPIILEIGAIVLFAAVVAVIGSLVGVRPQGAGLMLVSLLLAIVPAAIWLVAFYRLDAVEPEPKRYVFGVFLLGALLAGALGEPLIRNLFQVQTWVQDGLLTGLAGSIFVVGIIEQFLIYAAVRYTIFNATEYDSEVDGIVYGAAAGLGYATMVNIRYVLESGGVDLAAGVMQVSINALALAAFAGIMGYFLGRAKFESMGRWWLPGGLMLSAVLNGVLSFILEQLPFLGGLTYNPWYGLVGATIIAAAVFAAVFTLIRRANARLIASGGAA